MEPNIPYVILLILVTAISGGLILYSWRYRSASSVILPFMVLMLAVGEWSLTYGVELASATLEDKIFWAKMHWFGVATIPVAWFVFVLIYTGRDRRVTGRNVLLLSLLPALSLGFVWTNDSHHLLWSTMELNTIDGPFPTLSVTYGPWFIVSVVYFYLLILLGNGLLIQSFIHSPNLYRGQIMALLIGAFLPLVTDVIHTLGVNHPFPYMDITPVAFTVTGVMIAWAIYRYRLLDIVPMARDSLFDSMSEGVVILDAQNRVVDVNAAALGMINREGSEVIGLAAADLLADWSESAQSYENVPEAHGEITQMIKGEERHYDLSISPLRSQRGIFNGRIVVLRDITKRKQAEAELARYRGYLEELVRERTAELQESQQRYRALFESANDAVVILNLEGRCLAANQHATDILGYKQDELCALSFKDIIIPNEHQDAEDQMRVLLSGQPIPIYEQHFRGKDGSSIPVDTNILLVRDQEGTPLHIQTIFRDITKRKQAEAELKTAYERLEILDRLKDDFISSVSHELRTPMTNIKLYLHLIHSQPDSEQLPTYIETLRHETGRLEQIIEGILSVSQLMPELKDLTLTPVNLNSLITRFIINHSIQSRAKDRELTFVFKAKPELPSVLGNPDLLERMLEALVTNALAYTPAGGRIRVITGTEKIKNQQGVFLSIEDNGLGISAADLPHVFERFFRGEAALEAGASGAGLGLFTSREIIKRHGGRIDISRKAEPGKGVTVHVWLPADTR